jgi:hypothetical protein
MHWITFLRYMLDFVLMFFKPDASSLVKQCSMHNSIWYCYSRWFCTSNVDNIRRCFSISGLPHVRVLCSIAVTGRPQRHGRGPEAAQQVTPMLVHQFFNLDAAKKQRGERCLQLWMVSHCMYCIARLVCPRAAPGRILIRHISVLSKQKASWSLLRQRNIFLRIGIR